MINFTTVNIVHCIILYVNKIKTIIVLLGPINVFNFDSYSLVKIYIGRNPKTESPTVFTQYVNLL